LNLAPAAGGAVSSRFEGLEIEPFDSPEVLDVGRDARVHVDDGGGPDECIGHAHAMGEGEAVSQFGRPIADGGRDRHDLGAARGKPLLQPHQFGLVAAALRQFHVGHCRYAPVLGER